MPATKFVCKDGNTVPIRQCLKQCPNAQRCMFLPTLRAIAQSADRGIAEPTVTELMTGTREAYLKKTVNYMNNLLDSGCERFIKVVKDTEYIDAGAMKDALHVAFDEAYAACENYISEKARKKEGKWRAGGRRLNKVIELRNDIEKERLKYDALADAMQVGNLTDYDVKKDKSKSPRELSTRHFSIKAEISDWQNEGNSTDVYKIIVREGDVEC